LIKSRARYAGCDGQRPVRLERPCRKAGPLAGVPKFAPRFRANLGEDTVAPMRGGINAEVSCGTTEVVPFHEDWRCAGPNGTLRLRSGQLNY